MYIFELGRIKKLSLAELNNLFGEENLVEVIDHFAIFDLDRPTGGRLLTGDRLLTGGRLLPKDPQTLQNRLGGTIRIAEVTDSFPLKSDKPKDKIRDSLQTLLTDHFKGRSGKIPFALTAISIPDNPKIFLKDFLIFSKKFLKSLGLNSRFVNKPWQNATSAQIFKSRAIEKGIDIIILGGSTEPRTLYIARSLAIQDINSYSFRDFKKPFRDPRMGMLPPKLAQIMLNLADHSAAKPANIVYDPFCGSGTILTEALLQGKDAIGSDISPKAVQGTLTNLYWLNKNFENTPKEFVVFHQDAKATTSKDLPVTPDAIVTETYLGPPQKGVVKDETAQKVFAELTALHTTWLTRIAEFIAPGTKLVICLPAFRHNKSDYIRFPNFESIAKSAGLKILPSGSQPLIYDRPDQAVAREIIVMEK